MTPASYASTNTIRLLCNTIFSILKKVFTENTVLERKTRAAGLALLFFDSKTKQKIVEQLAVFFSSI